MQELRKATYAQNNSTSLEHEADNIRSSGAQRSQAVEKKISRQLASTTRQLSNALRQETHAKTTLAELKSAPVTPRTVTQGMAAKALLNCPKS
jgi:hypothetical protein